MYALHECYDLMTPQMLKPPNQDSADEVTESMQKMQVTGGSTTSEPELVKLQGKQRAAIERAKELRSGSGLYGDDQPAFHPGGPGTHNVYADLQDISFNESGGTRSYALGPFNQALACLTLA